MNHEQMMMANQKKVDETKEAAASACAALKAAQKAYDAAIKAMKEAANAALEYEDAHFCSACCEVKEDIKVIVRVGCNDRICQECTSEGY